MDTTTTSHTTQAASTSTQRGLFTRLVIASCNLYLVFMILYLLLRLAFADKYWWLALLNAGSFYLFMPLLVLIPVALVFRLWRETLRLGFLVILGVVWYTPLFLSPSPESYLGGTRLKVATFNLQGQHNEQLAEVEAWLREIDADVVLLQEVPLEYQGNGIVALIDVYPEQLYQKQGQLILSKHTFTPEETPAYGYEILALEIDEQIVAVYHVHLSYPFKTGSDTRLSIGIGAIDVFFNYDESPRNHQLAIILNAIEGETRPVILAGDFNLSQHSVQYAPLAEALGDSYRETASGLGGTWPADSIAPPLRLDYVFHSDDFHALSSEIGPTIGSDHLPFIVELELLANEPAARE